MIAWHITQYNRVCTFGLPCIPRVHFSDRPPDQIELFAWDIPHFLALRRGQICGSRALQIHQNWPFRVRHPSKRELRSGADSEDAPACQTCKLCFSQGTSRTFSLSRSSSPHARSTRTRSSSGSNRAFRVGHPALSRSHGQVRLTQARLAHIRLHDQIVLFARDIPRFLALTDKLASCMLASRSRPDEQNFNQNHLAIRPTIGSRSPNDLFPVGNM